MSIKKKVGNHLKWSLRDSWGIVKMKTTMQRVWTCLLRYIFFIHTWIFSPKTWAMWVTIVVNVLTKIVKFSRTDIRFSGRKCVRRLLFVHFKRSWPRQLQKSICFQLSFVYYYLLSFFLNRHGTFFKNINNVTSVINGKFLSWKYR